MKSKLFIHIDNAETWFSDKIFSMKVHHLAAFFFSLRFLEDKSDEFFPYVQCFSWVGTAFPQIFSFVLIFVKVEITPPVHYATS
jgi:hypothetical protein